MAKISGFDDWIDIFKMWREDIGFDEDLFKRVMPDYKFETKLDKLDTNEIEFGDFSGRNKWERILDIPSQGIRDALLHLIVFQGDTEFASVEQQRNLVGSAPTDYDLYSLMRVMAEEMRHGWQMCYLMVTHFGDTGKVEAMKQLDRRAFEQNRLLGSFNEVVENWLDFYTYTQFIDRDGKFQLKMLSRSAFAPLAMSMGPMLKEEQFHLGTGNNGLKRILKAGRIPTDIIQRYFNKWVPTAYDLFGTSRSSSAHWSYVWGLKGRYDEQTNKETADKELLNEYARELYYQEIQGLVDVLNKHVSEDQEPLFLPDIRFNRGIGDDKGKPYDLHGNLMDAEKFDDYLKTVYPTDVDRLALTEIFKENDWIESKKRIGQN